MNTNEHDRKGQPKPLQTITHDGITHPVATELPKFTVTYSDHDLLHQRIKELEAKLESLKQDRSEAFGYARDMEAKSKELEAEKANAQWAINALRGQWEVAIDMVKKLEELEAENQNMRAILKSAARAVCGQEVETQFREGAD